MSNSQQRGGTKKIRKIARLTIWQRGRDKYSNGFMFSILSLKEVLYPAGSLLCVNLLFFLFLFTAKHLSVWDDGVYLVPTNAEFKPIRITEDNDLCAIHKNNRYHFLLFERTTPPLRGTPPEEGN